MLDAGDLLNIIKRAALGADEQAQPCDFLFGTVTSVSPLKIRVEQKLELGEAQLVLTRNVSDYKITIRGGNVRSFFYTDGERAEELVDPPPHIHAVGEMEIEVKNALRVGENVILLKQRGGQKYLVLDRGCEA